MKKVGRLATTQRRGFRPRGKHGAKVSRDCVSFAAESVLKTKSGGGVFPVAMEVLESYPANGNQ